MTASENYSGASLIKIIEITEISICAFPKIRLSSKLSSLTHKLFIPVDKMCRACRTEEKLSAWDLWWINEHQERRRKKNSKAHCTITQHTHNTIYMMSYCKCTSDCQGPIRRGEVCHKVTMETQIHEEMKSFHFMFFIFTSKLRLLHQTQKTKLELWQTLPPLLVDILHLPALCSSFLQMIFCCRNITLFKRLHKYSWRGTREASRGFLLVVIAQLNDGWM